MNTTESNLPSKADLVRLIDAIRPQAGYWPARHDEPISTRSYPTEGDAIMAEEQATGAVPAFVQLTVGWSPESGSWGWQTGDNSYTGGAYGHPICGVAWLTHDSNADAVADGIVEELAEQSAY